MPTIASRRGQPCARLAVILGLALLVAAACSPSATTSPTASVNPTPPTASEPVGSVSPAPETGLTVRLTSEIHNPPVLAMRVEIVSDGQVVIGDDPWTTRLLTPTGLDQVSQEILGAPLLQSSGDYPAVPMDPTQLPVGLTAPVWTFTLGEGAGAVTVTSSAWLDEAEAQFFVPSPEREELDRLAHRLEDLSDWITADGWATASWVPYETSSYLLWVSVWTPPIPDGLAAAAGASWPFDGPIEGFGDLVETGDLSGPPGESVMTEARCGYLDSTAGADLMATLAGLGIDPPIVSRVDSQARVDLATETGWVGLYLSARTVGDFPTCADVADVLPPF